jgi:hypothetical protein
METKEVKRWLVTLVEDPDDPEGVILPFPEDMLEYTGWKEGDTILWDVQPVGSVILSSNKNCPEKGSN